MPKRNLPLNVMSIDGGGLAHALQDALMRVVGDIEVRTNVKGERVVTAKIVLTADEHDFLKIKYGIETKVPGVTGLAVAFPDGAGYVVDGAVKGEDGQLDLEAALHFDAATTARRANARGLQ